MTGDGTLRRSERARARERVEYRESSMECDTQSDSDEEENSEPLSHRLKLRAADPRYIINSEDCNMGDVILTMNRSGAYSHEKQVGGRNCHDLAHHG